MINNEGKSRNVALLMGYYDFRLHKGVASYAHKAGWILDSAMTRNGQVPKYWHGDGIISYCGPNEEIQQKILACNVPTVDLSQLCPLPVPKVLHDNLAIGRMAADHLLSLGLKNIACASTSERKKEHERMTGFRKAVEASGAHFHQLKMSTLIEELKSLPRPIGIMGQNDHIAMEIIRLCLEAGFQIPEEVAVIGVDNNELCCELGQVALTSVDNALEEIGYKAAELLDKIINGSPAPSEWVKVPPLQVIQRQSTNMLAIPHQQTVKALTFINQNKLELITIDEVAEAAGMCRRRLDDAFKKYLGRTIAAEINRQRLEFVKQRLLETDLKAAAISSEAHFSSPSHMTRSFKAEFGMTPTQFRERQTK